MRCARIFLCVAVMFFVAMASGCSGSAIKGAVKGTGKAISKAVDKTPKVVKNNANNALDVAELAVDVATSNSSPDTARPSNSKPSAQNAPVPRASKASMAAKAGAAVVGGAAVANEIIPDKTAEARQAFINYHRAITNGNYREAYDMLSYEQKEWIGDFNSYAAGYADTISSEVTEMQLVSSDSDSCTFDYTLTARDRYRGNSVKVQIFKGQVTMAKDGGRWYVRDAASSKVGERYE